MPQCLFIFQYLEGLTKVLTGCLQGRPAFWVDVSFLTSGLIQLVLILLVFRLHVLPVPRLPALSMSLRLHAPELALASWPLGHMLGAAVHSSPTTHALSGLNNANAKRRVFLNAKNLNASSGPEGSL